MDPTDFTERFAAALRRALASQGSRSITAARFAREFNLRAGRNGPISDETARRWMRGEALPELPRLAVLIDWLGIDPVALFKGAAGQPRPQDNSTVGNARVALGDVMARMQSMKDEEIHLLNEIVNRILSR